MNRPPHHGQTAPKTSHASESPDAEHPFPRLHYTSHVVIPARLASTRLPEKLLLRETGKPLLQHTYEAVRRAERHQGITIAVDCERLQKAVSGFGGHAVLTSANHKSGTDRVAEVAAQLSNTDIVVNVQGDEPEISPQAIDSVADLLAQNPAAHIATLATPIRQLERLEDPACVKVVRDQNQLALYFSRSVIPHVRSWEQGLTADPPVFLQHIGIYAYRTDFLLNIADVPHSPLEQLEKLEQLRFLQAGYKIVVGLTEHAAVGIDTPDDYRGFVQRCAA